MYGDAVWIKVLIKSRISLPIVGRVKDRMEGGVPPSGSKTLGCSLGGIPMSTSS